MKTIKQLADEIGVSKQAVRNQIANLELQSSLKKNGNQFAIDPQQEVLIVQAFTGKKSQSKIANQTQKKPQSKPQTSQNTLRFAMQLLEKNNSFLQEQIMVKDRQILSLNERLKEAQELNKNNQILLGSEQARTNTALLSGDMDNLRDEKEVVRKTGFFGLLKKKQHRHE